MSAPYIPFYIDDFDGATAHLSASEEGIYMRLIKLAWRTPRCELPNDVAFIARKCRSTEGEIDPVLREFFRLTRGRWVQARLKREYDKLADKKRERSEAGKIGGINRALKYKENVSSKAIVLLKQPEPEPEPEPIIKISAKKGSRFDGAGIDTLPPEWLFYCQSHGVPDKVSYSEFTKFSNYWSSKDWIGCNKA